MKNSQLDEEFEAKLLSGGVYQKREPEYKIHVPINFIKYNKYSVNEKILYQYLWTFGITKMYSYPSQESITKDLGLSRTTIWRTLKDLENHNGLYIISRYDSKTGKKLHNLYYLAQINKDGSFDKNSLDIVKFRFPTKKYCVNFHSSN